VVVAVAVAAVAVVAALADAGHSVPVAELEEEEEEAASEFEQDRPLLIEGVYRLKQNVLTRTIVQKRTIISYKVLNELKIVCMFLMSSIESVAI
jgi:hypothetical protein